MSKTRESQRHPAQCVAGQNIRPRGLLVEHGEKLLFALLAAVVLWCLLGVLGHEFYPRTPEQLASTLEQKRSALEQNTPENFPFLPPPRTDIDERAKNAAKPVEGRDRRKLLGWPRGPEQFKFRRGELKFLPPEDIRVHIIDEAVAVALTENKKLVGRKAAAPMGAAPVAAAAKVGSRRLIGVLITARVPRIEQLAQFRAALSDARGFDQEHDVPHYVRFVLQRSHDGGQTWDELITMNSAVGPRQLTLPEANAEIAKTFDGAAPEIVDVGRGDFIVPGFSAPLPPILGRDWDQRVAGGFPLRRPGEAGRLPGAPAVGPAAQTAAMGVGPPGAAAGPGALTPDQQRQNPPVKNAAADIPCDFLFRFFDFAVEEGRSYRYRVATVLENPNFQLPAALLNNVALSQGPHRTSPFSKPSQDVRVSPAGALVVAGPVRGGRADLAQVDTATVILRQRHRPTGSIIAHLFNRLESGQVLNFKAFNLKYENALGGVETTPLPEFDFQSDELLLDLRGGGQRGRPGELLLLDPNGRLIVRTEIPQPTEPRDAQPALAVTFASETKRLEGIYNHNPAANAAVGLGQDIGGLLPSPKKAEKKKPMN